MLESKLIASNRLRKEGRWPEASTWRDAEKKRLRAEGMNKIDSNEAAWVNMSEEFPPIDMPQPEKKVQLPPKPKKEEKADVVDLVECDEFDDYDGTTDISGDIAWVYTNLCLNDIKPSDSPGPGAWGLLAWARENRNRFFEQMIPKSKLIDKEDKSVQECYAQIADIHAMIANCVDDE